ncbi:MAG: Patatin [Caulobacter sp.]|nr:Patatin [Caulobacter sp.]
MPTPISLALQGGGSHGAYEWGVLDRLLEEDSLQIKAVTAASAGAMNAVCLAHGFEDGGRDGAKATLNKFWRAVSDADGRNMFGDTSVWSNAIGADWLRDTPGWRWAETMASSMSPYEFNPLNLNPLHDALEKVINFKAIRERSPIALYVAATQVRTSRAKIFRTNELTSRHIMASACLPNMFQAVEIDGEPYWDGGYLANPPLWPLFYDPTPDDILVVSLNPFVRKTVPKTPVDIMDRLNEITFNASLVAELRAIGFVHKLLDEDLLRDHAKGRYRHMLVHGISADGRLDDLSAASKLNTDRAFLEDLRQRGRKAADDWLAQSLSGVGVRSTLALEDFQ